MFEADTTGERVESGGQTLPIRPAERLTLWYHKTSSRARSRACGFDGPDATWYIESRIGRRCDDCLPPARTEDEREWIGALGEVRAWSAACLALVHF